MYSIANIMLHFGDVVSDSTKYQPSNCIRHRLNKSNCLNKSCYRLLSMAVFVNSEWLCSTQTMQLQKIHAGTLSFPFPILDKMHWMNLNVCTVRMPFSSAAGAGMGRAPNAHKNPIYTWHFMIWHISKVYPERIYPFRIFKLTSADR